MGNVERSRKGTALGSSQSARENNRLPLIAGTLSLGLHGGLAILLLFSDRFSDRWPRRSPEPHEPPEHVQIDLTPPRAAPLVPSENKTAPSQNAVSAKAIAQKSARLRAFLPSVLDDVRPPRDDEATGTAEPSTRQEVAAGFSNSWSYLSDAARPSPSTSFALALWESVDRELREDPLLSEYNHTGYVYFRFALQPDGQLRESSLGVQAEDAILKVRSIKALRAGIRKLQARGIRPEEDELWIGTRFSWIRRQDCWRQSKINGAFLSFCRHAVDARRDHSTAGRATRLANIALNPLGPGPFGFMEAYDNYQKENWRHDSDFDPFEKERRDPDFNL